MTETLKFIRVAPQIPAKNPGLIVTLHGWGANAQDVASLLPFFNLPEYEFIFPDGIYPHPHSRNGWAWYDLEKESMYAGLTESRQLLTDWLQTLESKTGVPLSRTILSGFSQGGAMTLDVGLRLPLAGLVVMSGYLHPEIANLRQSSYPPTLIMHGRQDSVVPLASATKARDIAKSLGVSVEYHEFDMGHEINPAMLSILRDFVQRTIG